MLWEDFKVRLNDRDRTEREKALRAFASAVGPEVPNGDVYNLHCHTFFSYNGYGFSPQCIAALARENKWFAAGIVDFDVLDGVGEFLAAARMLKLRATAGIESRVFVPRMKEVEINSPGEPGVAYHMGVGFVASMPPASHAEFARSMKKTAADRMRGIVARVNPALAPVELSFEEDAMSLTPEGNVTERHLCEAYRRKAESVFADAAARAAFWSKKLGMDGDEAKALLADPVKLEAKIRSKMMKKGGPGYVPASPESFPTLQAMNDFVTAAGAIPTIAWLNGKSAGEADPEKLLEMHVAEGAGLLNVIPDRNWNFADPEKRRSMVAELDKMMQAARKMDLAVIVGTEMNAPGLKLVDDFAADALKPYHQDFLTGAAVAVGHTRLTAHGKGYFSEWAKSEFPDRKRRNEYFAKVGRESAI